MRVLVYGAGVIGCFLAHTLCTAGHEVTLVARGAWKETIRQNGLVLHHRLTRETTVDHPAVVESPDADVSFDAAFAVMQYQQLFGVLDVIADLNTPLVVLVGNNMAAEEMSARIAARTKTPKTVLFGFQGTAGSRENGAVSCIALGGGSMSIGALHSAADAKTREIVETLFAGTRYRLSWENDMDGWCKTHLTLILPIVYLCYAVKDCNLRKTTSRQRRRLLDAAGEACALLEKLGVPLLPESEADWYRQGAKRKVMAAVLCIMAKTFIGELAASCHARHAVTEMEALDQAFMALREEAGDFPMPAFDALRSAMPSWEEVHARYDRKE